MIAKPTYPTELVVYMQFDLGLSETMKALCLKSGSGMNRSSETPNAKVTMFNPLTLNNVNKAKTKRARRLASCDVCEPRSGSRYLFRSVMAYCS